MIPIQDLLNRIRWDPEFDHGHFELAYWDRVARRLVRVPFDPRMLHSGDHFFFEAATPEGELHEVPLHRVRTVYRNGIAIWHRPEPLPGPD
ncbi:MAG: DUF504 domain-containing protein [Casimicrobiaceae bacterium]